MNASEGPARQATLKGTGGAKVTGALGWAAWEKEASESGIRTYTESLCRFLWALVSSSVRKTRWLD